MSFSVQAIQQKAIKPPPSKHISIKRNVTWVHELMTLRVRKRTKVKQQRTSKK